MDDSQKNVNPVEGGPAAPEMQPQVQQQPQPQAQAQQVSGVPGFSIGGVLGRTFSTLTQNLGVFLALALIATVPGALISALFAMSGSVVMTLFGKGVEMILAMAVQGAVAYAVYQHLRGSKAGMGDSLMHGTKRLLPMILASVLAGLGIALGMAALLVPGLILLCLWSVTIPACVVEQLDAVSALKRSAALTKGYRWEIFALMVLVGIIIAVVATVAGLIALGIFGASVSVDPVTGETSIGALGSIATGLIVAVLVVVPQAFNNVMVATIYYDLRKVKEGMSVDSLARVFD